MAILGLVEPLNTHMYIAQAAGALPIANSFSAGTLHIHPIKPDTISKSIAIGNPAGGYYSLMVAGQSGGGDYAVLDEEAIEDMELLA